MQLDYLKVHQFQPRKPWWDDRTPNDQLKKIYAKLRENPLLAGEQFAEMQVSEKDLFKHSLIIPSSISYQDYVEGKVSKKEGYLFTYFRYGQEPYFADISL